MNAQKAWAAAHVVQSAHETLVAALSEALPLEKVNTTRLEEAIEGATIAGVPVKHAKKRLASAVELHACWCVLSHPPPYNP